MTKISIRLIKDYAEFLTWLVQRRIEWIDQATGEVCSLSVDRESIAELWGSELGRRDDWSYELEVSGVWDSVPDDEIVADQTQLGYIALAVPLSARKDSFRPYYRSRYESWDPRYCWPSPIFRAKSGQFSVFERSHDPWACLKRNPEIKREPDEIITLRVLDWVALADFAQFKKYPDDKSIRLRGAPNDALYDGHRSYYWGDALLVYVGGNRPVYTTPNNVLFVMDLQAGPEDE